MSLDGLAKSGSKERRSQKPVSCPAQFFTIMALRGPPHPARGVYPEPLRYAQGRSQRTGERARHLPKGEGRGHCQNLQREVAKRCCGRERSREVCVSGQNGNTPTPLQQQGHNLVDNKGPGRKLFHEPTISMIVNKLHPKSQNSAYCFQ